MAPMLQYDTALIVERAADARHYLASVLRRQLGCRRILQAASHADAEALLESGTELISWLFYDWDLAGVDPQAFLKSLRQYPGCRSAAVLVTTRCQHRATLTAALHAGGTDYLIKPFTSSILLFKLQRIQLARQRRPNERLQVHPSQEVTIRFPQGKSAAGTLVNLSTSGCLICAPATAGESARVYQTAHLAFATTDGMLNIDAQLRRIEADPQSAPDREHLLLAFQLCPLTDEDQPRVQRFIAALASSPSTPGVSRATH